MRFGHRPVTVSMYLLLVACSIVGGEAVGVNWGSDSSNLLPPEKVVNEILLANGVTRVKLSEADPGMLESLSGSGIRVVVGIRNEMLRDLSQSKKAAASWLHDNVTRYLEKNGAGGGVRIEYIAIGDEPFSLSYAQQFQPFVIGAATNIHSALKSAKLSDQIKLIVPLSSDAYQSESKRPSKAHFRPELNKTMIELLSFLSNHSSPFVLDINPFSSFQQSKNLSLNFHLFNSSRPLIDGRHKYLNYFDLSIDSLISSLSKLGFTDTEIMIGRIGWPTDGAINATSLIAQIFVQGLINHLKEKKGSPLSPKRPPIETYLFSLLDEDKLNIKNGNYEKHCGIFTFDGQAKYNVDFGQGPKLLNNAHEVDYLALKWCVLNNNNNNNNNNNKDLLSNNVSGYFQQACSDSDCSALSTGGSCSAIGWPGNVSYAFNRYYQANGQDYDTCDFGGLGSITTVDPSVGDCRFIIGIQVASSDWIHVRLVLIWRFVLSSASLFLLIR